MENKHFIPKKCKLLSGEELRVNRSKKACKPFGFFSGDRIVNSLGTGTVLGVGIINGKKRLIIRLDLLNGASYSMAASREELLKEGFRLIKKDVFLIRHLTASNDFFLFDASDCALKRFDLKHMDRVEDEAGKGYVVGICYDHEKYGNKLWVKYDHARGACMSRIFTPSDAKVLPKTNEPIFIDHLFDDGHDREIDISPAACQKFGFRHGDRIFTGAGKATILGVFGEKNIAYRYDKQILASYYPGLTGKNAAKFGFKILPITTAIEEQ